MAVNPVIASRNHTGLYHDGNKNLAALNLILSYHPRHKYQTGIKNAFHLADIVTHYLI
jgi:hypothetical protein